LGTLKRHLKQIYLHIKFVPEKELRLEAVVLEDPEPAEYDSNARTHREEDTSIYRRFQAV